ATTNTGPYTTDSNTVALYHFDETGGNVVADASGNGNNGTATGTTIVNGKFGKARNFDGSTNNYLSIPNSSTITSSHQITVEGWFYFNSFTGDSPVLFDKRSAEGILNDFLLYFQGSGDSIHFEIGIGGVEKRVTFSWISSGMSIGNWYHIAGTYNGSNIKLYLNGQLKSQLPATGQITYSNGALFIGRKYDNYAPHRFHGFIDEVRISNKARDPSEFHLGKHKR
ncbi:MAG: LamG domain-containing protein, partial [Ignavibacteria bacterium]|nr:LamG domain-containing protein [Ignavibacteria bacterium]